MSERLSDEREAELIPRRDVWAEARRQVAMWRAVRSEAWGAPLYTTADQLRAALEALLAWRDEHPEVGQ